jgi:hypothetical protein
MSYDLYLKPCSGSIDPASVMDYFRGRPNYTVADEQAAYENEDTGIQFFFDMHQEEPSAPTAAYPIVFNINYYRPSYFIREAEPEVSTFVDEFDCSVLDPQIDGMGEGEYQSEKFLSGWNRGNEFAYRAILARTEDRQNILTLPNELLHAVWQWNFDRRKLQEQVGDGKFVPRISFALFDGQVSTMIIWTDGIPMVFPSVDHMLVYRSEFAPRRFLRRTPDFALLSWRNALEMLKPYVVVRGDRAFALEYDQPPAAVREAVRILKGLSQKPELLPMAAVLDSEIVEKILEPR